jgi:hypothetical protein
MEPEAGGADDDGSAEEDAQHFATAPPEAEERGSSSDEKNRRVDERKPGQPRLSQDFPVLEADLGEKQRRSAHDRGDDALLSVHRAPPCEA